MQKQCAINFDPDLCIYSCVSTYLVYYWQDNKSCYISAVLWPEKNVWDEKIPMAVPRRTIDCEPALAMISLRLLLLAAAIYFDFTVDLKLEVFFDDVASKEE